jgi:tetratricopeptide (TPR) repeat protein
MDTVPFWALRKLAATALVVCLAFSACLSWAADDDEALRKQALALNDLTGNDALEKAITELLKNKEKTKKLLTTADRMARGKEQLLNYNAAFVLARTAQELKDLEIAESLYTVCVKNATKLQSGQKLAQSFGGLIDTFYENKRFDKVVKFCREFLEIDGDDTVKNLRPVVMERMIQAMARQGKIDDALKLTDNLIALEKKDAGWWSLQLKAWVLREGTRLDESAKVYELILERLDKDESLKAEQKDRYVDRNRYLLSGVYVDLKKIDKAAEHLQALLKKKPDDPTYNNDLGYIWADHDMNLDEAEKLIRKAIDEDRKQRKAIPDLPAEEDKDNAAYLDSLGWVLFKQKKYDEAKKFLLQAVEDKDGQHIEIFDHLADVHMALKEKDKAVAVWKKAVESAGMSKREQDRKAVVEKKLKDAEK